MKYNCINHFRAILIGFWVLVLLGGCQKINIVTTTTDAANLVGYMEKDPATFSEFLKVLERSQTSSFLNAYGNYTLFAPTNTAIKAYLQQIGKNSVDEISENDLKVLVRYHLLSDTISTPSFTDGKLPVPTMHGEYLITGVAYVDGASKYTVNRKSTILVPDKRVGNGVLHTINQVLLPSTKTLAKLIEENSEYSIFTQGLKATGYYDTLNKLEQINDSTPRWLTVLAQKDKVYQNAGINSFAELKAKYSNTGDPLLKTDSLHLYMGYHILTGLKYVADLVSSASHQTLAPQEVVLVLLKGDTVRVNEEIMDGIFEKGIDVNRSTSDFSATNGVLNDISGNIYIKVRKPTPVYFDLADQPEIRKLTSIFRKLGNWVAFNPGDLADVTWNQGTVEYNCYASAGTGSTSYYWNDNLKIANLRTASSSNNYIEFKTPLIIKGRYKVWVCWRSGGTSATKIQGGYLTEVSVDGEVMPRLVSFGDYRYGRDLTDAEINAQGWKRYISNVSFNNHAMASKLVGTATIATTGRHTLRFEATGNVGGAVTIDMVHFIPEDMDQYKPKFATDGSVVY